MPTTAPKPRCVPLIKKEYEIVVVGDTTPCVRFSTHPATLVSDDSVTMLFRVLPTKNNGVAWIVMYSVTVSPFPISPSAIAHFVKSDVTAYSVVPVHDSPL